MRTIKPFALGLQTRPIEYRRRIGLSVTASVYFPFKPVGEGTAWSEMSMWNFLGQEMPEGPLIDEGVVKLRSEYLVRGAAYPPDGPAPGCEVRAKVGPLEKRLHVFGTRIWQGRDVEPPHPFERMPIDWAHTWGGPQAATNPLGMGQAPVDIDGVAVQLLPHVELPSKPLVRPDQIGEPASFGMVDMMWPQRAQYRGTYDDAWFKEQSPGFANDLDWRFFNLAQPDQWFDAPPRGDEAFSFSQMHPTKRLVEGVLPGFRARCFTCHDKADASRLKELPLHLATIWFFPHAERGVMLFQGLASCKEDDGADIALMVGVLERLDEPKSDAHYADAVARRLDPVDGGLHSLRDSELLPSKLKGSDPEFDATQADFQVEGLAVEAARRGVELKVDRARADLRSKGMDPDKLGVKIPPREPKPSLENLPDYVIAKRNEALNVQVNALLDVRAQVAAAAAKAKALGIDLASKLPSGPPAYRAAIHLAQLQAVAPAQAKAETGQPVADPAALYPKLQKIEASQREAYLAGAHTQAPAQPMAPERARALRDQIIAGHARKDSFVGVDFTGADLSGLDLSGADFTGAWLESANLKGATLNDACFAYAVLAHANLEAVNATKADFTGANLAKSNLKTVRLRDCNLSRVILAETALAETDLRGCRLDNAHLLGATFGRADWRQISAAGLLLRQAVFKDVTLHYATLTQPVFIECDLAGSDFSRATLDRATFINCKADGTRFIQAKMKGSILVEGCAMPRADFTQADLTGSNLRGSQMQEAVLKQALLDQTDLSGADFARAQLSGASAKGALLVKTTLRLAKADNVNFMDAVLQRADLSGADLRDANLFGADLSRVAMDKDTRLGGAMLKRARTFPRRTAPAPEGAA